MVPAFIEPQVFTAAGIIAVVITATIIVIVRYKRKSKKFSRWVEALLGIAVLASGALVSNLVFHIQTGLMNGARLVSIQETYGVQLGSYELAELRAPRGAPPAPDEGEYTTFGVTQVVHEGKVLTLFLGWDGEEFVLFDGDGQPLPTVTD